VEPQLLEDLGHVVTGRALGDGQLGCDLAVGEAPGDEEHDLQLSRSKVAHRFGAG
jgi:hypothetical protein